MVKKELLEAFWAVLCHKHGVISYGMCMKCIFHENHNVGSGTIYITCGDREEADG